MNGRRITLDRSVRQFHHGQVLAGGRPGRILTLTRPGIDRLRHLLHDGSAAPEDLALAQRLVEAGVAHPAPPAPPSRVDPGRLSVVVPVFDRYEALDECLDALGHPERTGVDILVVDDCSTTPERIQEITERHGASLIRRPHNGGPGTARNDGLDAATTEFVALVDSDCLVRATALLDLLWQFEDAHVVGVAPRIRPAPTTEGSPLLARFAQAHSDLDMGADPSEIGPGRAVRYVPTATLVLRRSQLLDRFDPSLRVGEDVDFLWRQVASGARFRYDPSVVVHHVEPRTWLAWCTRRHRYGTSAAPLAQRHPGQLAPVELRLLPTLGVVGLLSRRWWGPVLAVSSWGAATTMLAAKSTPLGVPRSQAARWSAGSVAWTAVGVGHAATVVLGPLALGLVRRLRWRLAVVLALPPLVEWVQRRPPLDPVRWTLASWVDDAAYGSGVWRGCLRHRTLRPLLPRWRWR